MSDPLLHLNCATGDGAYLEIAAALAGDPGAQRYLFIRNDPLQSDSRDGDIVLTPRGARLLIAALAPLAAVDDEPGDPCLQELTER